MVSYFNNWALVLQVRTLGGFVWPNLPSKFVLRFYWLPISIPQKTPKHQRKRVTSHHFGFRKLTQHHESIKTWVFSIHFSTSKLQGCWSPLWGCSGPWFWTSGLVRTHCRSDWTPTLSWKPISVLRRSLGRRRTSRLSDWWVTMIM